MIKVEIYDLEYSEELPFSLPEFTDRVQLLEREVSKIFTSGIISVNIVSSKEISQLNGRYRKVDSPTDVLSFSYLESENVGKITEDTILGEIFLSLEYLGDSDRLTLEEVLRLLIHAILHIAGYDHDKSFTEKDYSDVEMYCLQEEILERVLSL
ncbi:MAG TPA: rRNA maturation RNase YbeY [bacterium]|nr:rRNA maturation RNase YbeY [bacterium]